MEQIEYARFVEELATAGFNSPRCLPETQYCREFELSMEALVANCEISDTDEETNQRSKRKANREVHKSSSLAEGNDEANTRLNSSVDSGHCSRCSSRDGSNSDSGWDYVQEGLRAQRSAVQDKQEETDTDRGPADPLNKELSFEQAMDISIENEMQGIAAEICSHNAPLNAFLSTPKPRTGPTKRTYDEANG